MTFHQVSPFAGGSVAKPTYRLRDFPACRQAGLPLDPHLSVLEGLKGGGAGAIEQSVLADPEDPVTDSNHRPPIFLNFEETGSQTPMSNLTSGLLRRPYPCINNLVISLKPLKWFRGDQIVFY